MDELPVTPRIEVNDKGIESEGVVEQEEENQSPSPKRERSQKRLKSIVNRIEYCERIRKKFSEAIGDEELTTQTWVSDDEGNETERAGTSQSKKQDSNVGVSLNYPSLVAVISLIDCL